MKSSGTLYWYGASSDAFMETDLSNNMKSNYFFFNGQRVASENTSNQINWYFADHLGSSRVVWSLNGTDDSDYYPFGAERIISSGANNHYKFTGKERDTESGLDNFGARYNSSNMGRFMSPDPSGLVHADQTNPQSLNLYSYVMNNPLNLTDPTGLWCVWEDGTHAADSSEGGWDAKGCAGQGGHWDPHDTITGIYQQDGTVTRINTIYGNCASSNCGAGTTLAGFDQTLQSYTVSPKSSSWPGFTLNLGGAVNWNFWGPLAGSGFAGLAIDSHGHVAGYWGGGFGMAAGAGWSGGVQAAASNGNSVCALGGPFTNVSGTGGAVLAGTADYFEGAGDAPGGLVQGGGATLGIGGGGAASVQVTRTKVVPFGNHSCVEGKLQ